MAKSPLELGKRERQLVETIYRLGEASVADVLSELSDPPTYSAVRAMLNVLVDKKLLKYRRDGKRYLYRPWVPREKAQRSALGNMLTTFFGGDALDAVAALLDLSAEELTRDELARIKTLIEKAQRRSKK